MDYAVVQWTSFYAVVRWISFEDGEPVKGLLMAHYVTLWEAERACQVFRDAHPTKMAGDATFSVIERQRNVCQQTVGGSE